MTAALDQVAELIRLESGISLQESQRGALQAAIERVLPGEGPAAFLELAGEPVTGRPLVQRLLDEITVQETAFLRNRHELEAVDWPALLERSDGRVRVWAAGCATGEEAYTLALLACEAWETAVPPVDVLGTDISEGALAQAEEGRYRRRAVAGLEPSLLERYFSTDEGDRFVVGPILRQPVRFQRHNLVHDPVPPLGEPRFDLIVCRNVFIYFDAATVEHVIDGLERALRPEAMLLLGAADALSGVTQRLADVTPPQPPKRAAARRRSTQAPEELLAGALKAADEGGRSEALEKTSALLREEPLNAGAYFVRGLVQLEAGASSDAVESLRRALYIDPAFSVAAFTLGRAYDALADREAARRAYERALRTLDPNDARHEALLRQVDIGDIAAACRARIAALR